MTTGSHVSGVVVDDTPADLRPHRGPFASWTLRRVLVTSLVTLFTLVILAVGIGLSTIMQTALERQLDAQVMTVATRSIDFDRGGDGDVRHERVGGPPLGDMLIVRLDSGVVQQNSVSRRDGTQGSLNAQQIQALMSSGLGSRPTTVDLGDQLGPYRLIAARTPSGGQIVTGLPLAPLLTSVKTIWITTGILGLTGFVLVGLGTAWIVRRSLRPLERVAGTATRVAHLPLSSGDVVVAERVPMRDTDPRTEVGQVGAALNDLLDHVEVSLRARQESEQQLRRFVADASHELRTPLASIRGYTELSLRDADLSGEVRHSLGRVESESSRMATLVEDLLLLARLDAGRQLDARPVDLTLLLMNTVDDARVAGPDHRWMLDLPDEAVEIIGDEARLTQVLVNLLANARLHTPAGTTVTGSVHPVPGGVVVAVEDDGPGIDPAVLPTIFQRFARGDAARNRNQGSTGLGLAIVDAVVAAHAGSITVDSRPGRTRLEIRLPKAPS